MTGLATKFAFAMRSFLQHRHLERRRLHAQIAARNHDAVGHFEDFIGGHGRLGLFDLCDDLHVRPRAVHDCPQRGHVVRGSDKRKRNELDVAREDKSEVAAVFCRERRDPKFYIRKIHALMRTVHAARERGAGHRAGTGVHLVGPQADRAVVDHNKLPGLDLALEIGVIDRDEFACANRLFAGDDDPSPALDRNRRTPRTLARADFWALQIRHDADRTPHLFSLLPNGRDRPGMVLMIAVRKIEPEDVHPVLHERADDAAILARGAERGDDFGFFLQSLYKVWHREYPSMVKGAYVCFRLIGIIRVISQGIIRLFRPYGTGFVVGNEVL